MKKSIAALLIMACVSLQSFAEGTGTVVKNPKATDNKEAPPGSLELMKLMKKPEEPKTDDPMIKLDTSCVDAHGNTYQPKDAGYTPCMRDAGSSMKIKK